jgi:hypothetical protein
MVTEPSTRPLQTPSLSASLPSVKRLPAPAARLASDPVPANRGTMPRPPVLFLDIEASGLGEYGWPVEIGWAVPAAGGVAVRSMIVAPRPSWRLQEWSAAAARVHGLGLSSVLAGRDADAVAAETDGLAGFFVVSDNPEWDQLWLDRLREGRPRIPVHGLRGAIADRLTSRQANAFAIALFRSRAPHRAGADAARLAEAWRAATCGRPDADGRGGPSDRAQPRLTPAAS